MCESDIVFYPKDILRQPARDVTDVFDSEVVETIERLTKTMAAFDHCVGLAANQIGSDLNIFVADASKNKRSISEHGFVVVVNPRIQLGIERKTSREGCMSVPDLTGNVSRALSVKLEGLDGNGKPIELEAKDFEARVFQHEVDHLLGKVFLDRVSSARDVFARITYREPGNKNS